MDSLSEEPGTVAVASSCRASGGSCLGTGATPLAGVAAELVSAGSTAAFASTCAMTGSLSATGFSPGNTSNKLLWAWPSGGTAATNQPRGVIASTAADIERQIKPTARVNAIASEKLVSSGDAERRPPTK